MRARESGAEAVSGGVHGRYPRGHRRYSRDSVFLFFTDDVVAARPLMGAANTLVGLGASVAGLAMLPVDGGDVLRGGLRGVLWSLPSSSFENVRKGSFDHVRPE